MLSIIPKLFLGVEYCATFQAALYIQTRSLMHQSDLHAASVALSRAADKRKLLINIHKKPVYRHLDAAAISFVQGFGKGSSAKITYFDLNNSCKKFDAFIRSVTIMPKIYAKPPD